MHRKAFALAHLIMSNILIKTAVRTMLSLTSREKAARQARAALAGYMGLAARTGCSDGSRVVCVPPMTGIDEDMRRWSFFMILEHNTIVNRSITSIVEHLVRGEEPSGPGALDPKKDVMPSSDPGEEEVEKFRRSVEDHLTVVAGLGPLRGTRTKNHPIFGPFDAHKWNSMFGFHLRLHFKQAAYVIDQKHPAT